MKAALDNRNVIKTLQEHILRAENVKYGARKKVLVDAEVLIDALDLIKMQERESERWKQLCSDTGMEVLIERTAKERLNDELKSAVTEALKEFAVSLKKKAFHIEDEGQIFKMVHCYQIDKLLKERIGGKGGNL